MLFHNQHIVFVFLLYIYIQKWQNFPYIRTCPYYPDQMELLCFPTRLTLIAFGYRESLQKHNTAYFFQYKMRHKFVTISQLFAISCLVCLLYKKMDVRMITSILIVFLSLILSSYAQVCIHYCVYFFGNINCYIVEF